MTVSKKVFYFFLSWFVYLHRYGIDKQLDNKFYKLLNTTAIVCLSLFLVLPKNVFSRAAIDVIRYVQNKIKTKTFLKHESDD